jgi:adenosylhomocysteine nucleosidase
MNHKILLLSATELEHGVSEICGIPIFQIGVGKVSSAHSTTHLIHLHKPDLVINFGSCGNLKGYKVGELLRVGSVHNDIDARPFADYGQTPFSEWGSIQFDDSSIQCFSTDYFYDSTQQSYSEMYMRMVKKCDVIDMELYSVAQVCKSMGVPLQSFKWVSDDGSSSDWEKNAKLGFDNFKNYFQEWITNAK